MSPKQTIASPAQSFGNPVSPLASGPGRASTVDFVFVIDPDVKRRASISHYLNNQGFFAEPFETIREFLDTLPRTGLVLLHDTEAAVSTLTVEVARRQALFPIVAYSEDPLPMRIVEAVLAGALGYAAWPGTGDALIRAIGDASARSAPSAGSGSRKATVLGQVGKLSRRERQILAGMTDGMSNREIATHLSISPRTVELHRANMLNKIGARSSAEAIRMAIETSLSGFDLAPPRDAT